jgi:PAS domain S-box-containing protein
VLARPAAQRTAREQEDAQRNRSLAALQRLAAFLPSSEPTSLLDVLEAAAAALEADTTALYGVTTDPPGINLTGAVNLPADFPAQLGAGDAQACLQPLSWQLGQRPDSAFARAARSAGWSALAAHPLSDGHSSSGLILAGYRPGRNVPQSVGPLLAVVANLVWALLTHQFRAQARRRVEAHAASLARQLDIILDATADGVVMLDSAGEVVEINAAGQRMLGYRTEEVAGSRAEDILVSPESLGDEIAAAVTLGRPAEGREVHLVRRDGHQFPARLRVLPMYDGAGERRGAAAVITDLTAIKTVEAQSQHLEQRATLGDMSAIFAHEIRNPLNGISTGLELLSMRLPEGDPLRENVANRDQPD